MGDHWWVNSSGAQALLDFNKPVQGFDKRNGLHRCLRDCERKKEPMMAL